MTLPTGMGGLREPILLFLHATKGLTASDTSAPKNTDRASGHD